MYIRRCAEHPEALNMCRLFVLLNLIDALVTIWALRHGYGEANPVMSIALRYGAWVFLTTKMGLATVIAYCCRRRTRIIALGVCLTGAIVVWNILVLCLTFGKV
jgi:hypothetical protein